jgi:hypothetical protein
MNNDAAAASGSFANLPVVGDALASVPELATQVPDLPARA